MDYTDASFNAVGRFSHGDKVKCIKADASYELHDDEIYIVHDVKHDGCIRVAPQHDRYSPKPSYYSATRFTLVESRSGTLKMASLPAKKMKHVLIHNGALINRSDDLKELQDYVTTRLRKEPTEQFHIYTFEMTGQLPSVPVEWAKD